MNGYSKDFSDDKILLGRLWVAHIPNMEMGVKAIHSYVLQPENRGRGVILLPLLRSIHGTVGDLIEQLEIVDRSLED